MLASQISDESAGGEVQVMKGGAMLTQTESSLVGDLVAIGQNQLVNETAVLGEGPVDRSSGTHNNVVNKQWHQQTNNDVR